MMVGGGGVWLRLGLEHSEGGYGFGTEQGPLRPVAAPGQSSAGLTFCLKRATRWHACLLLSLGLALSPSEPWLCHPTVPAPPRS